MLFRPYLLGIIAFWIASLLGETIVQAQATTDFTLWKDTENAEAVPGLAQLMLVRDFRNVTGTAREELLARTLLALKDIASDANVVPSTRYNAILAAGQLVSEPRQGNPPVAYPAALTYLIEVYQEPDAPHYLKYGALLGIVRHAIIGIDADKQDRVIDLLLETATTEFEAGEVTLDSIPLEPAVWDWFRQTALDGLTALKTVGTDGRVVTELLSLINRKSLELEDLSGSQGMLTREDWGQSRRASELASKAAKTLGDLGYTSEIDIDAKKMTDTFIRLTKAVCDIEYKMAMDSIEQGGASPNPAMLLERIVINVKMCTQSIVWGIRSGFVPVSPAANRPVPNSFYDSLETDDPAMLRLDVLLAEIIELATFLDEGDQPRRAAPAANTPREFRFNLPELRDALAKTSEALADIQLGCQDAPRQNTEF